jgi:hypothetical protein
MKKPIKRNLEKYIVSEKFLIENFEKLFYENIDKKSYTEKWIDEFIIDKNYDLLIADMCECAELLV